MNNFHVGQKVVCVRPPKRCEYGERLPVKGEVYTIREIASFADGVGLKLVEIVNSPNEYVDGLVECSFRIDRFRPVKTTNIDVFLKMLEPTPEPVA